MDTSQNAGNSQTGLALSVVVPCFNEEEVLRDSYIRITSVCQSTVGSSYEILFVNDGSRDHTWEIMQELSARDQRLVCINLSRNFGHQAALMTGIRLSKGCCVLVLDADLQDPPELLPEMIRAMNDGADVVYGLRRHREGESWFKLKTASIFYRILNMISDVHIPQDVGDFRLMNRKVVDVLSSIPEQKPYVRGLVAWVGFHQKAVLYDRDARMAGESNYSLYRMMSLALDGITGFSIVPLRIISGIAFLSFVVSLLLIAYIFYGWIALDVVPGWASTMSVVVFIGSVQMLALGVIGEYIGRCYMEAKRRPTSLIKQIYMSNDIKE